MRPLIADVISKRGTIKDEDIEKEYDIIFLDSKGRYNADNKLYDLEIHNNLPLDQGGLFNRVPPCDFCEQSHKDNCPFAFEERVTLDQVLKIKRYERELELTINWKVDAKVNFKMIEIP